MKIRIQLVLIALSLTLQNHTVVAQGSLTPPGAPAPAMKSLAQIEPRTPISSLPYTINTPGSYYLTTNLTGASTANGIAIYSGNVTLDLNGFTMQGGSNSFTGIVIGNYTNVVVRNGTVVNWGRGIDGDALVTPCNVTYENLNVFSNASWGILADAGSIIRNCLVLNNGGPGLADGIKCNGGDIVDCVVRGSGGYGIYANRCTIRNCRVETNAFGIYINTGTIVDTVVNGAGTYGVYMDGSYDVMRHCEVRGVTNNGIFVNNSVTGGVIADCLSATNGYGINVTGSGVQITGNEVCQNSGVGIMIQGHRNRVDGNTVVTPSGVNGIFFPNVTWSNNVVVRNIVAGNGGGNFYNPGTANDVGPIGSASSATSPWANISH
jgi:hypothetical protein